MRKNEGFTLVELMIVISIIAILAVVLIPKVGSMKDAARDQGVATNMNSVRAYLELKINSRETTSRAETTRLIDLLDTEFVGGDAIVNPITNGESIGDWSQRTSPGYSVIVVNVAAGGSFSDYDIDTQSTIYPIKDTDHAGKVFVYVFTDGYLVWGKTSDGLSTDYQVVK